MFPTLPNSQAGSASQRVGRRARPSRLMSPTTLLTNARVVCMDDAGTTATALAWADGRIEAVGDETRLRDAYPAAEVQDGGGAVVLPGFIDPHHHVSVTALYGGQVALDGVADIPAMQARLAEASARMAPGRWLVATGWDEHTMRERRAPTAAELQEAVPDRPVFAMHYTCHRAIANVTALRAAGIDATTPSPPGGVIERDGLLIERGMSRVEALARAGLVEHDAEGFFARIASHYRALLAVGITRVADMTVPLDLVPMYRESARRGDVLVPTHIAPVSTGGWLEEPHDVLTNELAPFDEEMLEWGPVKLVFDGAPGCAMCFGWWTFLGVAARTAALTFRTGSLDPIRTAMSVSPRVGAKLRSGISIYDTASAQRVIAAVTERGLPVATHAIGNAAVDLAVAAYQATNGLHRSGRARLEHASFADAAVVQRIADLGIAVVVQPHMISLPAFGDAASIPGLPFSPLRRLLDAGVLVAGSSDYPVVGFDPLDGVRSAVSRLTARGWVKEADQCISPMEALRLYTRDAADVLGCLDRVGTIEVGKRADLVVLDGDPQAPDSLSLRQTILGGNTVWRRPA